MGGVNDGGPTAAGYTGGVGGVLSANVGEPLLSPSSVLLLVTMAGVATLGGVTYRALHATATEQTNLASLTDEERFIVDLLHEHGGRIRQSHIVAQSPWSKSKVSRLLTGMERNGHVEKVQVGRENAVVLTDTLPGPSD